MDISTEKRIEGATAKEVAELEALRPTGYFMVPYMQLTRLMKESQNYRLILTTYQCNDINCVKPLLDSLIQMCGPTMMLSITKELERLLDKREQVKRAADSIYPNPAKKSGETE